MSAESLEEEVLRLKSLLVMTRGFYKSSCRWLRDVENFSEDAIKFRTKLRRMEKAIEKGRFAKDSLVFDITDEKVWDGEWVAVVYSTLTGAINEVDEVIRFRSHLKFSDWAYVKLISVLYVVMGYADAWDSPYIVVWPKEGEKYATSGYFCDGKKRYTLLREFDMKTA